jgi:hypothetical protein
MYVQRFLPLAAVLAAMSACARPAPTFSDHSVPAVRASAGASGMEIGSDSTSGIPSTTTEPAAAGVQAASGLMFGSGT